MNASELIAFLDSETSMTEAVLLNLLLDYFTSTGGTHIAASLKGLMGRAGRGNPLFLDANSRALIDANPSGYQYPTGPFIPR